ncbi:MAG: ATP synthase F0 subunit C [Pseudomonadota bacterium]|nr:ATP synthase F0 subunit C [Pseudomonadota bacterium]
MDAVSLIGAFSVLGACLCMGIGSIGSAVGEGNVAASALQAMAQQPDEASRIRSTMFVAIAMVETTALYALLIAFLVLYANPFWNYAVAQVQ